MEEGKLKIGRKEIKGKRKWLLLHFSQILMVHSFHFLCFDFDRRVDNLLVLLFIYYFLSNKLRENK